MGKHSPRVSSPKAKEEEHIFRLKHLKKNRTI
jgi:hypothetical protein